MPSWQDEYLGALQARDRREKSNVAVIESYTRLANRNAALHDAGRDGDGRTDSPAAASGAPEPVERKRRDGDKSPSLASGETLASLRQDLAEAQRSRGVMETRLRTITEELQKAKIQSSLDSRKIRDLTKEKAVLTTGLRDRDEELKGKTKLLEDLHDETVSMTLQLNMADQRSGRLEQENKELVDRWMKKMAKEADAMNDKSKFM